MVFHYARLAAWSSYRVIVCSGSDFQTLFPGTFGQHKLKVCKLQMLKTRPNRRNGGLVRIW